MKVIITGSTGMVGKGVLLECLDSTEVEMVTVINRRSLEMNHAKLHEIIHSDFTKFEEMQGDFSDVDACFHCMGVSSVGMKEEPYRKLTYDVSLGLAKRLFRDNPNMVFNYISGVGTDSTESGRIMWARVKGKTENDLLKMGFKKANMFRPGMIIPERGIKSATGWINVLLVVMKPFFGLFKGMSSVTTTSRIGKAMINSVSMMDTPDVWDPKVINAIAEK